MNFLHELMHCILQDYAKLCSQNLITYILYVVLQANAPQAFEARYFRRDQCRVVLINTLGY